MTDLRTAAQQALELCDRINDEREIWGQHELRAVCERLRAALAEPTVPSDCTDSHQPVQEPLSIERLRDALVASRIIHPAAVEDPDEYDDGVTLFRIEALHRRIT